MFAVGLMCLSPAAGIKKHLVWVTPPMILKFMVVVYLGAPFMLASIANPNFSALSSATLTV